MRKVFEQQLEERKTRVMAPVVSRKRELSSKKTESVGDKILIVDTYQHDKSLPEADATPITIDDQKKFFDNVPSLKAA